MSQLEHKMDALERNMKGVVEFTNVTREDLRASETEVKHLRATVQSQAALIQALQGQVGMLLAGQVAGGATGGS